MIGRIAPYTLFSSFSRGEHRRLSSRPLVIRRCFWGILSGVPFWWVIKNAWPVWLLGCPMFWRFFCAVDLLNFRRIPSRLPPKTPRRLGLRGRHQSPVPRRDSRRCVFDKPAGLREF